MWEEWLVILSKNGGQTLHCFWLLIQEKLLPNKNVLFIRDKIRFYFMYSP